MNVLPQISASDEIILILSGGNKGVGVSQCAGAGRLGRFVRQCSEFVPITRVRELDSIISLRDGEVAVLGGLLKTEPVTTIARFPVLVSCPVLELCLKTLTKELIRPNLLFLSKRV